MAERELLKSKQHQKQMQSVGDATANLEAFLIPQAPELTTEETAEKKRPITQPARNRPKVYKHTMCGPSQSVSNFQRVFDGVETIDTHDSEALELVNSQSLKMAIQGFGRRTRQ